MVQLAVLLATLEESSAQFSFLTEPGPPDALNSTSQGAVVVTQPVPTHSAIDSSSLAAPRDFTNNHSLAPAFSNSKIAFTWQLAECGLAASVFSTIAFTNAFTPPTTLPIWSRLEMV